MHIEDVFIDEIDEEDDDRQDEETSKSTRQRRKFRGVPEFDNSDTVLKGENIVFNRNPLNLTCPHCSLSTRSKITWIVTERTKRKARCLSFIGCCLYPYISHKYKAAHHHCGHCGIFLGRSKD